MKFENLDPQPVAARELPDVSVITRPEFSTPLARVGMEKIEMPIRLDVEAGVVLPARIDAFVSLDKSEARGIHMSRLYLEIVDVLKNSPLNGKSIHALLERFLSRHAGLSNLAEVQVNFQLPVERAGLLSGEKGYRLYPVSLRGVAGVTSPLQMFFSTEILYSSTCPCSAALSRELIRSQFLESQAAQDNGGLELNIETMADWLASDQFKMATPHAQRSLAKVAIELANPESMGAHEMIAVIDQAESALGTPVQSAVKRVDEQEFARLNGENLMFCEDAARKLRAVFEATSMYLDYSIYVEHQESLHPHSAVAKVVKGRPNGFRV